MTRSPHSASPRSTNSSLPRRSLAFSQAGGLALLLALAAALGGCAKPSEEAPAATASAAPPAPALPPLTSAAPPEPTKSASPAPDSLPTPVAATASPPRALNQQQARPPEQHWKAAAPTEARQETAPLEKYGVVVAADRELRIPGPPGEMKVWIGNPDLKPTTGAGMQSGETLIPALSSTAKISPFAPGMEVEPKESACTQIDPTGSEVRFQLKATEPGSYKVGADVALYRSGDCSGLPIPKTTSTVQVEVTVNKDVIKNQRKSELVDATWDSFLGLWGNILALISATTLFLLRKQLFKWFGFTPKE